jgi:hypothetical protein
MTLSNAINISLETGEYKAGRKPFIRDSSVFQGDAIPHEQKNLKKMKKKDKDENDKLKDDYIKVRKKVKNKKEKNKIKKLKEMTLSTAVETSLKTGEEGFPDPVNIFQDSSVFQGDAVPHDQKNLEKIKKKDKDENDKLKDEFIKIMDKYRKGNKQK